MTKRTTVVLPLVVILLAAAPTIAWSQCRAKRTAAPYQLKTNEAWVNFGTQWNGWSATERLAYLNGLIDGGSRVYLAAFDFTELTPERRECLRERMAVVYEPTVLSAVVTDLYRDPANTYISPAALVFIARDKLDGKDVDVRLRNARETDRAFYRLN